jgi:hypothetical protein
VILGLGAAPPQFVIDAVAAGIDPEAREAFRQVGRNLAAKMIKIPSLFPAESKPPGPWERLMAPIIDPLSDGISEEATPKLVAAAAVVFGAGMLAGYLLRGRR